MRTFCLVRDEDISGISGLGEVAEGVEFSDGVVVMRWRSDTASTVIHQSMAAVDKIHGHGGKTRIVWGGQDNG